MLRLPRLLRFKVFNNGYIYNNKLISSTSILYNTNCKFSSLNNNNNNRKNDDEIDINNNNNNNNSNKNNNSKSPLPTGLVGTVLFAIGSITLIFKAFEKVKQSISSEAQQESKNDKSTNIKSDQLAQLINNPSDVVGECIDGLLATQPHLAKIENSQIVVRRDWNDADNMHKVGIISGGGSGHEPSHAGFVGPGCLTAAVCGDIFSSPSVNSILDAIRFVGRGHPGVLLIVKNYTGDRLNFGLALEKAKAEGINVEMVVVADDVALPKSKGITGARGIAGTIFVHKIAGACAELGNDLKTVAKVAHATANSIGSLGVALSNCNLPGQSSAHRLNKNEVELGMGIHGEPGYTHVDFKNVNQLVSDMISHMTLDHEDHSYLPVKKKEPVAVIINNLGTCSQLEMSIITNSVTKQLKERLGLDIIRCYNGTFMSSLDMKGFSISLLRLSSDGSPDDPLIDYTVNLLDLPTIVTGWNARRKAITGRGGKKASGTSDSLDEYEYEYSQIIPRPKPIRERLLINEHPKHEQLTNMGKTYERIFNQIGKSLIDISDDLTRYDAISGDGDCGSTFKRAGETIIENSYPYNHDIDTILFSLCDSIGKVMGGSSGALYQIFLVSAATSLSENMSKTEESPMPTPQQLCDALGSGIQAIEKYGGARQNHRTMLDAMIPAHEYLKKTLNSKSSLNDIETKTIFKNAVELAQKGAMDTKTMKGMAGRSNYVNDDILYNVPDPGAVAVATWMKATYQAYYNE